MNIFENLERLDDSVIAVQKKGRLTADTLLWLNEQAGSDFDVSESPFDRTDELTDTRTGITLLGCSAEDLFGDIGKIADLGIGGADKLYETILPNINDPRLAVPSLGKIANLGFGSCRMVIASRDPEMTIEEISSVVTSYPDIADRAIRRDAYAKERIYPDQPELWSRLNGNQRQLDIAVRKGSVEMVGRLSGADAIVDVVDTGASLEANCYTVTEEVFTSEAMLVGVGGGARLRSEAVRAIQATSPTPILKEALAA